MVEIPTNSMDSKTLSCHKMEARGIIIAITTIIIKAKLTSISFSKIPWIFSGSFSAEWLSTRFSTPIIIFTNTIKSISVVPEPPPPNISTSIITITIITMATREVTTW